MSSSLEHALKIVDDDWAAHDPLLAPVLPVVLGRGVGHDWHRAGTFKHHLLGVSRSLTLWRQPDRVRLLGLLHSVYGNAYIDVEKFDAASERGLLRDLVGADVEALVHRFCTISRNEFAMVARAALLGGNCRVGLEDNLYLGRGQLASNGQLVERALRILESIGVAVMSPAQTREYLSLRKRG